tara:strand:- start:1338 stop:1532 length:195 start_codon:yes stop_codon:yes gene_type:complete
VISIDYVNAEMTSSIINAKKIMRRLKMTENSISSFSLYSMHCFQMLNWSEAYFPALLSPKDTIF